MKISFSRTQWISIAAVAFMLLLWKSLALYFDSDFILPHPEDTLVKTLSLFGESQFLFVVGATILRGVIGFAISLIFGVGLGIAAGLSNDFSAFLKPILVVLRSTPVIAIILLALIWLNANSVPIFIAILTMFPFICTNTIDGIRSVDKQLVEMAQVYRVGMLARGQGKGPARRRVRLDRHNVFRRKRVSGPHLHICAGVVSSRCVIWS